METSDWLVGNRKIRTVKINGADLLQVLSTGIFMEMTEGIPENSVFSGMAINSLENCINIYFESEEFEVVQRGEPIPVAVLSGKVYRGRELKTIKKIIESVANPTHDIAEDL